MSTVKGIDYGDTMSGIDELMGGVRADISGSACDENIERRKRQKTVRLGIFEIIS
jgi:hypothetical protein